MSGAVYGGLFLIVILIASLVFVQQENFRTCGVTAAQILKSDKPPNYYWDPLTGFAKPTENETTITASVRAQQQVCQAVKQDIKRVAEYEAAVEQQTLVGRSQAIADIPQPIEDYDYEFNVPSYVWNNI
jgi:hypothetical protein